MFCSIAAFLNFPVRRKRKEEREGGKEGEREEEGRKEGEGVLHVCTTLSIVTIIG